MKISLGLRLDPDFKAQLAGLVVLIRNAYDRGAISWARRCELIDTLSEDSSRLFEVRIYERPQPDAGTALYGVFLEPSASLLAEIGGPAWQP